MSKPKLTVIEGGIPYLIKTKQKLLVSAYVTNTRLMGVLALYAHWRISGTDEMLDFHQFFYIDCEESGLETYTGILGSDHSEIDATEQALVGGLGAEKIEISYPQLSGILTFYRMFNEAHGLPLPKGYREYSFLLEPGTILSPDEHTDVMRLICGEITSDYQAVNYFLMRCFGQDHRAAAFLAAGDFDLDIYAGYKGATFCKNTIDKDHVYDDGATAYLCESLIERKGNYEIIISRVIVKDLKIVGLKHCSGFAVSSAEAAMMLAKPEFVTVYEVLLSEEDMENNIGELTINFNTIMSEQENGRLFMAFKKNNDHVNSRVFRLSNDVKGIYYLTDFGQLIVASYTLHEIRYLENQLKASPLAPFLIATAKYEFKEPVLFEFMQSDFEDFDDFLNFIRDE